MWGWRSAWFPPRCTYAAVPARSGRRTRARTDPNAQAELETRWRRGYTAPSRTRTRRHPEDLIYMDTFPDLGSLTDQELKELIKQLTDEEMEISYRRRILHGKIDILRAELVNRLRKKDETGELVITGADVQQLTDILAGRVPGSESE